MKRTKYFTISEFYCTQCGNKGIPLPRKDSKPHLGGHLKKLYCIHCQKETNHAEVRPFGDYNYEDFEQEWRLGRFLEDGTKIEKKDLPNCKCKCPYNIDGKCWNSNGSYKCSERGDG